MTKEELEYEIAKLKHFEKACKRLISSYKSLVERNQEVLDDTTLQLSKLELKLAKIEEEEELDDELTDIYRNKS